MSILPALKAHALLNATIAAADLRTALTDAFLERTVEADMLITALIAEQHCLLLGPPGTAKSAMINSFAAALGFSRFSILLTKHSQPDEVFGPISIKGLKEDRYVRVTTSRLPEAQIAFVDEIFKANSAILNGLLTALNERMFDNGGTRQSIPLQIAIGASNELPQDEGLEALFDRFTLRRWVLPLKDRNNRRKLLSMRTAPAITATLSSTHVQTLRTARAAVNVEPVIDLLLDLCDTLQQEHRITVSDRRWCACVELVAARAVLDGRLIAQPSDLTILESVLWDRPEDASSVAAAVLKCVNRDAGKVIALYDSAVEMYAGIDFSALNKKMSAKESQEMIGKIGHANREFGTLMQELERLSHAGAEAKVERVRAMREEVQRGVQVMLRGGRLR